MSLSSPIAQALAQMREAGAEESLVSGSGPTVVGLFAHANPAGRAQRAAVALSERAPAPIAARSVDASFAQVSTLA